MVTHQAAVDLLKRDETWIRWTLVPPNVKPETLYFLNLLLGKESVPEIRSDMFDWLMAKALPDATRREFSRASFESTCSSNELAKMARET
jgi:hypothetical protein